MRQLLLQFAFLIIAWQLPAETVGQLHGDVFVVDTHNGKSTVAGARVSLKGTSFYVETLSNEQGNYDFQSVPAGEYLVEARAPRLAGSVSVVIKPGATLDVPVQLNVESVKDSVTVSAPEEPAITRDPSDAAAVSRSVVLNAPNKYEQFDSLLPLIPGVVRGPDGLINMKGARSSQSGALLNSASVTDPATGNPAISVPIDVVESVKVISNPYDPEYGRLAGAVSKVETLTSSFDAFHLSVQNILPRPRKRSGDFVGLEAATPRLTVTGPLVKNKIAITQSVEYRFIRIPVSSLPQLQRDMKLEGFNSFTQVDVNVTQRQSFTASFALYPQKYNYLGLNTFNPQSSTPDLHQRGYMATIQHRYMTGAESMLVSQFSYKRFDADVTANSNDPYQLFVESTAGGFYNRQNRDTYRTEWQETYQFAPRALLGSHQLKAGIDYAHDDYTGRVNSLPVTLFGVSGIAIESLDFGSPSRFGIRQNETAWFLADKWAVLPRLTVDLGLRFDHDSVTSSTHTAPRGGFALMLTKDGKTLLKGGAGLFYARVPLNVASFPFLPDRTITTLAPTGGLSDSVPYTNAIVGGLRNPRSNAWNVEVDRQLSSALTIRAAFQERNTSQDFLLTPELQAARGILSLANTGHDFYREFQVSGLYKVRRGSLNASYVRSKAFGDLNDFNQYFGNNPFAIIQPNERRLLPFDAPNRFLLWAQYSAPLKLTVMPVFDLHTGFPYSLVDEYRDFVGPRDSQRFRRFNSVDLQITRPVNLPFPHKDLRARVGFSVYNLLNRFNPRDVQNDVDSGRFGETFNGVGRTFRGKFVLEF